MPLMQLDAPTAAVPLAEAPGAQAAPGGGGAGTPAVAVAKPAVNADVGAVLIGYVAVAVGAGVGIALWSLRNPSSVTPGNGISVFAPLYILAQAIERFIEPFSSYI